MDLNQVHHRALLYDHCLDQSGRIAVSFEVTRCLESIHTISVAPRAAETSKCRASVGALGAMTCYLSSVAGLA